MTSDPKRGDDDTVVATREDLVADTFIRLADSLVDDYDVIELLDFLTDRCAQLLGIDEAGVVLVDPQGGLQLISSTSERMRHVELFEIQREEGPCRDAFESGKPASVDDLAADHRWPTFGPQAMSKGFRSAYGLPMRLREETIGALNLFGNQAATLDAHDQRLGQAFADAATIGILHERSAADRDALNAQLQGALNSRIAIEQAKGIIAEQVGADLDEAFGLIRSYARTHSVGLSKVALLIVAGGLDAAALAPSSAG